MSAVRSLLGATQTYAGHAETKRKALVNGVETLLTKPIDFAIASSTAEWSVMVDRSDRAHWNAETAPSMSPIDAVDGSSTGTRPPEPRNKRH